MRARTQPPEADDAPQIADDGSSAAADALAEESKQLVVGGATVVVATLLAQALSMGLTLWIARLLGPDDYGLIALAFSVLIPLAAVASLGLSPTLIRFIPVHLGNNDNAKVAGVIASSLLMSSVASITIMLLTMLLAGPLSNIVFSEPRLVPVLRVMALTLPLMVLSGNALAATRGSKVMTFDAIVQVTSPLFRLIGWVVGLLLVTNLLWAAVGATVFQWLMAAILSLGFAWWVFRGYFGDGIQWSFRTLWVYSAPLILSSLMYTLAPRMDRLVLGVVGDTTVVGIYSLAASFMVILKLAHSSIVKTFLPVAADAYNRVSHERARSLYVNVTRWDTRLTFALVVTSMLFAQELLVILGEEYAPALLPFMILSASVYIATLVGPAGAFFQMTNRQRVEATNAIAFFVISPAIQLLFAQWLGWIGVAVGVLVVAILLAVVQVFELKKLYGFHPFQPRYGLYVLLTLAAVVVCGVIGLQQTLAARIATFAIVALSFVGYIYFTREPGDIYLYNLVTDRLFRRKEQAVPE